MKFTLWDQLFLNVTGRLPRKTQQEVDILVSTKAMIAKVTELEHQARLAAIEKNKSTKPKDSTLDLLKPTKAPSKKKATPKKPSKG